MHETASSPWHGPSRCALRPHPLPWTWEPCSGAMFRVGPGPPGPRLGLSAFVSCLRISVLRDESLAST